jgi:hypothetical protein
MVVEGCICSFAERTNGIDSEMRSFFQRMFATKIRMLCVKNDCYTSFLVSLEAECLMLMHGVVFLGPFYLVRTAMSLAFDCNQNDQIKRQRLVNKAVVFFEAFFESLPQLVLALLANQYKAESSFPTQLLLSIIVSGLTFG